MEECKGCLALNYMDQCINRLDDSETHQCPCVNCIVKTMCKIQCDEFSHYLKAYGPRLFKGKYTFRFRRINGRV